MLKFKSSAKGSVLSSSVLPDSTGIDTNSSTSLILGNQQRIGGSLDTISESCGKSEKLPKSLFICSESGFSKANVIFQNVNLPLAWPTDEYFGTRRECREFTIQLLFRTAEGQEIFSRVREHVNRTVTDVCFDESFVFPFQSPDFCIEVVVYCKRTDENATPSLVQSLSRSLGRSVGQSLKAYLKRVGNNTISANSRHYSNRNDILKVMSQGSSKTSLIDADYLENYRNPDKMSAIACVKFRLRNASLNGRTHTYSLETLDDIRYERSQLLPIYGSICAEILVQPSSVCAPLAEGMLDVFLTEDGALMQRTFCRLQGAQLTVFIVDDRPEELADSYGEIAATTRSRNLSRLPSFVLPISRDSIIEPTAFPSTLRLVFAAAPVIVGERYAATRSALLVSESSSSFLGWRNALALQIADCAVWEDFASAVLNPHAFVLRPSEFDNDETTDLQQESPNIRTLPQHIKTRQRAPIVSDWFHPSDSSLQRKIEKQTKPKKCMKKNGMSDSSDSAICLRKNSELDNQSEVLSDSSAKMPPTSVSATMMNTVKAEMIQELGTKLALNSLRNATINSTNLNNTLLRYNTAIKNNDNNPSLKELKQKSNDKTINESTLSNSPSLMTHTETSSLTDEKTRELREDHVHQSHTKASKCDANRNNGFIISLKINDNDETVTTNYYTDDCISPRQNDYSTNLLNQPSGLKDDCNLNVKDLEGIPPKNSTCKYVKNPRIYSYRSVSVAGHVRPSFCQKLTANSIANSSASSNLRSEVTSSSSSPKQSRTQWEYALTRYQPKTSDIYNKEESSIRRTVTLLSPSSSSSSSNHETQIAQAMFMGSDSSKASTPTSHWPITSMQFSSLLTDKRLLGQTSLYTPLASRPTVRTTTNFVEKFENYKNVHNMPRRPGILKKCSSVSFSSQSTSFDSRSMTLQRLKKSALLHRNIDNGWNTITSVDLHRQYNMFVERNAFKRGRRMGSSHTRYFSCAAQTVLPKYRESLKQCSTTGVVVVVNSTKL